MGRPKALVRAADGTPWLVIGVRTLLAAAGEVVVVLGCAADEAAALVGDDPRVRVVVAEHWERGMGSSLRAGLAALLAGSPADAALVHLVDLPGTGGDVARAVAAAVPPGSRAAGLARAAFAGVPGHPVLLGRNHWAPIADEVAGADAGARGYLAAADVTLVDCGDLASGADVDTPQALGPPGALGR